MSKEVQWIKLQLLEGADAGLSNSQGSNQPIETENTSGPEGLKPNEWTKLDRIVQPNFL